MAAPTLIGVACRLPSERVAFAKWLETAQYQAVAIDIECLARELKNRPIEALVATADAVSRIGLPAVLKLLTVNRPLVVIGRVDRCPPEFRQRATWLDSPTSMDTLTIGLALALAEGRPARRSLRKQVLHLPSTVDGVSSQVLDVSNEGVRLQLTQDDPLRLPPFFTLQVEVFSVTTVVRRVWIAHPSDRAVLCGGTIQRHLPRSRTWTDLVTLVPAAAAMKTI